MSELSWFGVLTLRDWLAGVGLVAVPVYGGIFRPLPSTNCVWELQSSQWVMLRQFSLLANSTCYICHKSGAENLLGDWELLLSSMGRMVTSKEQVALLILQQQGQGSSAYSRKC
jgi:hypothetical protein